MYLLDTQILMDLLSKDQSRAVFNWLGTVKPGRNDLFISVLSLGQIAHAIEDMEPADRNHWRRLLQEGRRLFEDAGGVIDVDAAVVDVWRANLRGCLLSDIETADEDLGEDDRLIIASAIARGYTLVTESTRAITEIVERTSLTTVEP